MISRLVSNRICLFAAAMVVFLLLCFSCVSMWWTSDGLDWFLGTDSAGLCEGESISVSGDLVPSWQVRLDGGAANVPMISDGVGVVIDLKGTPRITGSTNIQNELVGLDIKSGKIMWIYLADSSTKLMGEKIFVEGPYAAVEIWEEGVVILSLQNGNVVLDTTISPLEFLVTPPNLFFRDWDRATGVLSLETGQEIRRISPTTIDSGDQFQFLDGKVYSIYGNELRIYQDAPFDLLYSGILMKGNQPIPFPNKFLAFDSRLLTLDRGVSLYDWNKQRDRVVELWSTEEEHFDQDLWPPVVDGDNVYIFSITGSLVKLSLKDGEILAHTPPPMESSPLSAPVKYGERLYTVYSDGTLRSFTLPEMTETIELKSSKIRNHENEMYFWHFPGVTSAEGQLIVSFGCNTLYAFRLKP